MGLFRVRGRLVGPTGRGEEVDLLVDTGATLLVLPRALAARLELVTRRCQSVLIAGGQRAIWPVAEVGLTLEGLDVTTPCFIAPEGPALLGAVALESLFLGVDPVAKRLIPVEGMAGEASVDAEDEIAVEVLDAGLAREGHGRPQLAAQDIEGAGDAGGAVRGQPPQHGASHRDHGGAEGDTLQHRGAPSEAAVHDDGGAAGHR